MNVPHLYTVDTWSVNLWPELHNQLLINGMNININNASFLELKGDILVAQAATFYMASFETTSSVLSFTLYELTKNVRFEQTFINEQ